MSYLTHKYILFFCLGVVISVTVCATDSLSTKPLINSTTQTTILEIKDADKIFKQKEQNWWDEYSSGLIALVTIALSSFISFNIANKQTKVATKQLELMKEQIDASSKSAIDQVKANNISAARIEWIQKLRPLLSDQISLISDFDHLYNALDKILIEKNPSDQQKKEVVEIYDKLKTVANECDSMWHQILLFLNKNEKEHLALINCVEKLSETFTFNSDTRAETRKTMRDELIDKSRVVLKEAWEQAKNIN